MTVLTVGPHTDFKQWKKNFLTFLSLVTYVIPQFALRELRVCMDETAKSQAFTLMLHPASENKLAHHFVRCVSLVRPYYATLAWVILCGRLDGRSLARSLVVGHPHASLAPRPFSHRVRPFHASNL
jgi:hypothetical protein